MTHENFTSTLLQWYAKNGRDLPWRETKDPYSVWLSEVILQQTRVDQGIDYWLRFIEKWPSVDALAAATEDEVLKMWQGLGYYSRARNLHTAAKDIVNQGGFPQSFKELIRLKGVGEYTAAAVGSIAFGLPFAAIDGNVYRVLARHFGLSVPIDTTTGKKAFRLLADSLLPAKAAGTWNQAMMDFGALQCTPRNPRCMECPLQESCVSLREKTVQMLPVKSVKAKRKERWLTYFYIKYGTEVAVHRRGKGDIWQGLWEPVVEEKAFPRALEQVKHELTHQVIHARIVHQTVKNRPSLPPEYIWIKEEDLGELALPRLVEKLLLVHPPL